MFESLSALNCDVSLDTVSFTSYCLSESTSCTRQPLLNKTLQNARLGTMGGLAFHPGRDVTPISRFMLLKPEPRAGVHEPIWLTQVVGLDPDFKTVVIRKRSDVFSSLYSQVFYSTVYGYIWSSVQCYEHSKRC